MIFYSMDGQNSNGVGALKTFSVASCAFSVLRTFVAICFSFSTFQFASL